MRMTAKEAQAAIIEALMDGRSFQIRFSCGCLYGCGPVFSNWIEACRIDPENVEGCLMFTIGRLWARDTGRFLPSALQDGDIKELK